MQQKIRIRWRAPDTDTLHAIVDGQITGTIIRHHASGWIITPDTLKRYPPLFGVGNRALSTWRAKLGEAIRIHRAIFGRPA